MSWFPSSFKRAKRSERHTTKSRQSGTGFRARYHRALRLEALEWRTLLTVTLQWSGAGNTLSLTEGASGATPSITISEPSPDVSQLKIDLGSGHKYAAGSSTGVTGLAYQTGSPATSQYATIDISLINNVSALVATLPGDGLTLGAIRDLQGGVGSITASAATIAVAGINTLAANSLSGAGNVSLSASGNLAVDSGAVLQTGTGTIALTAGGTLSVGASATVFSSNSAANAIALNGAAVNINSGSNPAVVGAERSLSVTPTATLTGLSLSGLITPATLACDAKGDLYVPNPGVNTVSEFTAGSTTPSATLTGLSGPAAVALDASGNVYVANASTGTNTVSEFAPGATTAGTTLTGSSSYPLDEPDALAFDGSGNLYVCNWYPAAFGTPYIDKFTPGSTAPSNAMAVGEYGGDGAGNGYGVTIDNAGHVCAAGEGEYYDLSSSYPLGLIDEITFAASGNSGSVWTYYDKYGNSWDPIALAFDRAGNFYVDDPNWSSSGAVFKFAPGAHTPEATLTGLSDPVALAFDGNGNLYVANSSGNTVSEFATGATSPTATLTGLNDPDALVLDDHGDLFVANKGNNTVSEFSPTSTASVAAPAVTSISPATGSTVSGASVTITGSNFTGATAVMFGNSAATITSETATQIVATAPTETAGTVYVTVTGPGGTSATSAADQFSYVAPTTSIISLSGNLAFGNVTVGSSAQSTLTISNTGNSPLTVSSISYSVGFSGNWSSGTIAAGSLQLVTVTFSPTLPTNYSGTVTVNSNETSGTNTISDSGTGTAGTSIISLSGNLAFGNVTVGSSAQSTFAISNTGNSTLTVSSINYPSGFSGNWSSGTIAAGSSQPVTVTFSPTSTTSYGGTVIVISNATSGTSTTTASGTGTAAPTTFTLSSPASFTVGSTVTVQWTAANVVTGGTVSLAYDTTSTWGNPKYIEIDGVTAANGSGSYSWNTTGLTAGTYYMDGYLYTPSSATAIMSHLTTSFNVTAPAATTFTLASPASFTAGSTVTVQWTAANVPSGSTVSLAYDTTSTWGNPKYIEIDGASAANGSGSYNWNTTGMAAGTYYLDGYLYAPSSATAVLSHLATSFTVTAAAAPTFTLSSPASFTTGSTVTIQWTAANVASGSLISLAYDTTSTWGNPKYIEIDGASAANGSGSYNWNTTGLTAGTYYLDGYLYTPSSGTAVMSHLTTSFTVAAASAIPAFALSSLASGSYVAGQTIAIQWTAANVPSGSTISLAYDTTSTWGNPKWIEIDGVGAASGNGTYNWNTTGLAEGTYYLDGYLYTPSSKTAVLSNLATSFTVAAPTFTLSSPASFTAGSTVTIQWTAANVPSGSTVSLAYDTTSTWGNPKYIEIDGVTAASGSGSYTWNTTGLAAGTYYLDGYLYTPSSGTAVMSHLTTSFTVIG